MTDKPKKDFDAVEMMRTLRDKLSAEIEGMTLEQELEWLDSREMPDSYLRRLRERAVDPAEALTAALGQK